VTARRPWLHGLVAVAQITDGWPFLAAGSFLETAV
jgi:hypothetical protein